MSTRMALAHEWLALRAGSEKTFEVMAATYPDADLFALTREPDVDFELQGRPLRTTFLDRPAFRARRELTLPLMPAAWRALRTEGSYDKVLTSSHACVKGFPPGRVAEHYCYCYTPMRYAWDPELDARTTRGRALLGPPLRVLRRWDRRSARHVDHFAAISRAVQERIRRYYDRDAVVIHPPVDTEWFQPREGAERSHALAISRFIPYKRLDLAIAACARAEVPLVVAGSGPGEAGLRRAAEESGGDVRFEIGPSDERLRELYQTSLAVVFPAHEDFGIVPVEAQACGTPVAAIDRGGARDTIVEGETGYRVREGRVDELADAVRALADGAVGAQACRANAEGFSTAKFSTRLKEWMGESGTGELDSPG